MLLARVVDGVVEYPVDLTQFNDSDIIENYSNYGLVPVVAVDPPVLPWYKTTTGTTAQYVDEVLTQVWNTGYKHDNFIKMEYYKLYKEKFDKWNEKLIELDVVNNPQLLNSQFLKDIIDYLENLRNNYRDYKAVYTDNFSWPVEPQA